MESTKTLTDALVSLAETVQLLEAAIVGLTHKINILIEKGG